MTSLTIKEYFAAAATRLTDRDARIIGPVLCELSQAGDVTVRAVVQAAQSPQCALHSYFEWDDSKAANLYREGQAAEIIDAVRVRVVAHGQERTVRAYKIKTLESPLVEKRQLPPPAYLPKEVATVGADEIMGNALRELQEWRIKYRPYAEMLGEFKDVATVILNQISEFMDEFQQTTETPRPIEAIEDLRLWAERHGRTAGPAAQFSEQFGYMIDAITSAEKLFDPDTGLESPIARENRLLRDRLLALEGHSSKLNAALRSQMGFTGKEADLLCALVDREQLDKRAILAALYSPIEDEWPDQKIVDVFVCKIRSKLSSFDVEIETIWGLGYRMSPEAKQRLKARVGLLEVVAA